MASDTFKMVFYCIVAVGIFGRPASGSLLIGSETELKVMCHEVKKANPIEALVSQVPPAETFDCQNTIVFQTSPGILNQNDFVHVSEFDYARNYWFFSFSNPSFWPLLRPS